MAENRGLHDGRVAQRQVFYLGEINDSQKAASTKAIEVFDEDADGRRDKERSIRKRRLRKLSAAWESCKSTILRATSC